MEKEIEKFLSDHLGFVEFRLRPIDKGGSDRTYSRVLLKDGRNFIFMAYGVETQENAYWVEINRFLNDLHVPVPRIIAFDHRQRFLLLEDAGEVDFYMLRTLPWHKRRRFYLAALSEIHRLHRFPLAGLPAGLKISEGYDEGLYRWEHQYFLDNFVDALCGYDVPESLMRQWGEEASQLVVRLQEVPLCLIHRDFQSQNIMLGDERPVFIDFQGMRPGNLFYDLGSLICDPYVTFVPEERNELIAFYYRIMEPDYTLERFTDYFWEGSAQRLMQALGAYGFLGLKKNKTHFLKHAASGIKNLVVATARAGTLPALNELARECMRRLADRQDSATAVALPETQ